MIQSNNIRTYKVSPPTKQEIQEKLNKANSNTRTSLCKMCHVEIYTR